MKILISNDDGVYAPGIRALSQSLSQLGEVVVMAPDRNRSGASNSLTLDNPLRVKTLETNIYSVEGTPTDSVHLALRGFLKFEPDLVVSGINAGANLGDDVMYSGTVAAAMEGRFLGFPAIAISLDHGPEDEMYYSTAAGVAKNLIVQLQVQPMKQQTILNVNVPNVPYRDLKGFQATRLGNRHRGNLIEHTRDPRGAPIYWIGPAGKTHDDGPGTDFYAIQNQFVSITPLHLDLTHYKAMDSLTEWIAGFNEA